MNLWGHRFSQNANQKLPGFLPYPLINFQGRNLGNFWLAFCYEFCLVADTDDLWKFMSKSSGIDVGSLMNSWIRKMGFPVVVVTVIKTPDIDISGKITLKLTQHRFCGGNTNSPQKEPMLWSIPIQGDIWKCYGI